MTALALTIAVTAFLAAIVLFFRMKDAEERLADLQSQLIAVKWKREDTAANARIAQLEVDQQLMLDFMNVEFVTPQRTLQVRKT